MKPHSFAFLIHPIDPVRDVRRKYPALAVLPGWLIDFLSIFHPPVYISEICGVRSWSSGEEARGWFVACPLSARMMVRLPTSVVYRKIIQSGRLAERLGAHILGLGAFTSVVGDGGITVGQSLTIPVTTGNSYTVATAMASVRHAARTLNLEMSSATVAIVGASGSIGSICAELLAAEAGALVLVGRRESELQRVAFTAQAAGASNVTTTTGMASIKRADVVIAATSSLTPLVQAHHLRPGAIVCDVARPRDVALQVAPLRKDVLIFEGGVVSVPGNVNFGFDFGFPPGTAYACMAETMALALEGRFESFTLGKRVSVRQVQEIEEMAMRHGFRLAGLRNLDRALSEREVAAVARLNVGQRGGRVPAVV